MKAACVLNYLALLLSLTQPIRVVGESDEECPLECFHNGKCALQESTSQFYCLCPSLEDDSTGFQGIHCEEPYVQCIDGDKKSWRCHNHGKCNVGALGCDCPAEFSGSKFCETYSGPCSAENGDLLVGAECTPSLKLRKLSGGETFGIFTISIFGATFLFGSGMMLERWRMRRMNADFASQTMSTGKPAAQEKNGNESENEIT